MTPISLIERISLFLYNRSLRIGEHKVTLNEKHCKKLIDNLEWLRHHDEYYVIHDLKNSKITWHFGIEDCLGYEVKNFELFWGASLIHPFISEIYNVLALAAYRLMDEYKDEMRALKTRYIINIPVRKATGNYVLVKQVSMPLQFDSEWNVTSYITTFSIGDGYRGVPLRPRVFHGTERKRDIELRLFEKAAEFLFVNPEFQFKDKELEVLELCYQIYLENDIDNAKERIMEELEFGKGDKSYYKIRGDINRKAKHLLKLDADSLKIYQSCIITEYRNRSNIVSCLPEVNDTIDIARFLGKSGILDILIFNNKQNQKAHL